MLGSINSYTQISDNKIKNHISKKPLSFKSEETVLIQNLPKSLNPAKLFIQSQESLSSTRVIQDTATNWLPKAVFTRSLADFGDMSFLEGVEDFVFYFMAPLLGEQVFRKIYPKLAPSHLKEELNNLIPKSADELLKNKDLLNTEAGKRIIPLKAGMILGCAAIPAAEYGLSFAKNLFTLKVFNKSDFNNIANLEKNSETKEHQENLKKHSKFHLIASGIASAIGLGVGTVFATVGHKSTTIQKISEKILTPYNPIINFVEKFKPLSDKKKSYLKNLINLDFGTKVVKKEDPITHNEHKVTKLKLGTGQLAITAITGFFGYKKAAEDRGKLDVYEVCTRVPIVVLYTIFGSSIFDTSFKSILHNKGKYKDLITKDLNNELDSVPSFEQLPALAKKIAQERKTDSQKEFNRLVKEKAIITAIPYGMSLVVMGFFLAGITRFWTQYRFNQGIGNKNKEGQSETPPSNEVKTKATAVTKPQKDKSTITNYFSWMNNH